MTTHVTDQTRKDIERHYGAFAERLNTADIDGLMALYADESVFAPAPGVGLDRREDIRGALGQFAGMTDVFTATVRSILRTGDIALAVVDWTLAGKDQSGNPLCLTGATADVLRRDGAGQWAFLIDNPFGTAAPNA